MSYSFSVAWPFLVSFLAVGCSCLRVTLPVVPWHGPRNLTDVCVGSQTVLIQLISCEKTG